MNESRCDARLKARVEESTCLTWVARQNKLEILRDKAVVNKREIRESDGRAHHPDTAPLTPWPTQVPFFMAILLPQTIPNGPFYHSQRILFSLLISAKGL
jgi:hypothetical protein